MSGDWQGGDYTAAGDAWAHAADDVTAFALAAGPEPGRARHAPVPRVLDVGTGSGPAALAAARAGAHTVGVDLEPGLLRIAADRARRAELPSRSVGFVAGDAQALPFAAGAFDVVVSTFGVMFAPEPSRAAAELVRVCRPGGLLAVASWTPDGIMGRIAPTVRRHLGHRPEDNGSPMRWGDPAHVRAWFTPLPIAVRTRVERVRVAYPSVAHAVTVFENKPGPLREHRAVLEAAGRWKRARADLADLFAEHNEATDGSLVLAAPYLLVWGRVGPGRWPDPGAAHVGRHAR
ncbi:class I SAM-dependent methyltransferase [Streptomyces sp. TRM72054]|uniref:class I SAM-dependent methyltransferase n=1 Tax=Streptomyces sp. TRM72054 TaxID=2870562 RepID=UPI001C8CA295|nr:class I SAM-dependent methyltransferase [Streptomyces sp. TRM72054]MBX9394233.1 class I SAM-dependent methyltransferase [Streptomyces sp. TRM72054]